jgi:hypothetical protein
LESKDEVAGEDENGAVVEEARDVFVGPAAVVFAEDEVIVLFRKGPAELVEETFGLLAEKVLNKLIGSEVGRVDGITWLPAMVVVEFQKADEVSTGSLEVDSTVMEDNDEAARPEEKIELVTVGIREGRLDFPCAPVSVAPTEVELVHLGEQHDDEEGGPALGATATLTLVETVMEGGVAILLIPDRDELDGKAVALEDAGKDPFAGRPVSLAPTDVELDIKPDNPGMVVVDNELLR